MVAVTLFNICMIVSVVLLLTFGICYGTMSKWYKIPEGRAIMFLVLSLIGVAGLSVLLFFFGPDYPGRLILRDIVGITVVLSLGYLNTRFFVIKHKRDKELKRLGRGMEKALKEEAVDASLIQQENVLTPVWLKNKPWWKKKYVRKTKK